MLPKRVCQMLIVNDHKEPGDIQPCFQSRDILPFTGLNPAERLIVTGDMPYRTNNMNPRPIPAGRGKELSQNKRGVRKAAFLGRTAFPVTHCLLRTFIKAGTMARRRLRKGLLCG